MEVNVTRAAKHENVDITYGHQLPYPVCILLSSISGKAMINDLYLYRPESSREVISSIGGFLFSGSLTINAFTCRYARVTSLLLAPLRTGTAKLIFLDLDVSCPSSCTVLQGRKDRQSRLRWECRIFIVNTALIIKMLWYRTMTIF